MSGQEDGGDLEMSNLKSGEEEGNIDCEKEEDCDKEDDCEKEEEDQEEETSFKEKAKKDYEILKALLKPIEIGDEDIPIEKELGVREEFLKDPTGWLSTYKDHHTTFKEDDHYLGYACGLLELIVLCSPFGEDMCHICPPLLLLQKTVTVEALKERHDPMRTALKLQYHMNYYSKAENDKDSIYDRKIDELEEIPNRFALNLMAACITPAEVVKLMHGDDDTMLADVLKSNNTKLIASKFYQKMIWNKFWGSDTILNNNDRKELRFIFMTMKRVPLFLFWNIFILPVSLFSKCQDADRVRKMKEQFFSPFSSYLADIWNYTILLFLLLLTIVDSTPDNTEVYTRIKMYNNGSLSVDNNLIRLENGLAQVLLSTPDIPISEWMLWACIFARFLTEYYQFTQKKGNTAQKLGHYVSSAQNISDIMLLLLLVTGMICKLATYIHSNSSGIYSTIITEADGHESYIPEALIFTICFYCTGTIFALCNFLFLSTIHIPGIGPMLIAMQHMFVDIGHMLVLFVFFIFGFLAPFYGIVKCYRAVHNIDGIDDDDDFNTHKSVSNSILTLVWGMFGEMSSTALLFLYESADVETTVFMAALLVVYAVIMGLMCMNILIAMMCSTYSLVTAEKSRDWRYSQFKCILSFNAVIGNGMPFLFPVCIPYMLFWIVTKPCQKKRIRPEPIKVNNFAKFLCKYRLKD